MKKLLVTLVLLSSGFAQAQTLTLACQQNRSELIMNVESSDCFLVSVQPKTSIVNKLICDVSAALGTTRTEIMVIAQKNGKSTLIRTTRVSTGRLDIPTLEDDSTTLSDATCTLTKK